MIRSHRITRFFVIAIALFFPRFENGRPLSPPLAIAQESDRPGVQAAPFHSEDIQAVAAARLAVRDHPASAQAFLALGTALIRVGDNDGALQAFERAASLDASDAQAWYLKGLIEARKNMWAPASRDFSQAVMARPAFVEARIELGDMLRRRGDFNGAASELNRAIELKPEAPLALYDLGLVRLAQGNLAEAEEGFRRAMVFLSPFPQGEQSLGDVLLLRRDYAGAASCYRQVLARQAENLEAANGLAVALSHLGDPTLAAEASKAAQTLAVQKLQRQRAEIDNARALDLWHAGQNAEALAAFSRSLADDPDFADAHYHLGCFLWQQADESGAIRQYRAALAARPRYPEAFNTLGEAFLTLGQTDRAVQAFREALNLRLGFAPAHLNLGKALEKLGSSQEALEQLEEAIVLAPQTAAPHIELGLFFARSDGTLSPRARTEINEGLRIDPSSRTMIPEGLLDRLP
ncbi:MAG TPA: tetratricopeptide repeat protein [Terriglobia bacterium]|nr:tetratricopeptide repeat protein [Terriglobia bacterium]